MAVGSSMMSTLGSKARARAMATACCRPPESVSTGSPQRGEGKLHPLEHLRRLRAPSCRRSTSPPGGGPAAEEDVGRDVEVAAEGKVLVDHLDARAAGIVGRMDGDGAPLESRSAPASGR